MFNLSAAMAGDFVKAVKEMREQIATLGANPIRISINEPVVEDKEHAK